MNKKALIVVTGAKLTPAKKQFNAGQFVTYLDIDEKKYKMNAASGVVRQMHQEYELFVSGYNQADAEKFQKLGYLDASRFKQVNLLDNDQLRDFVKDIKNLKESLKLPVHLIHYGGASDTKVSLPNDSLMSHSWDMNAAALGDLINNNCTTLINLLQEMRRQEIFSNQKITKVAIISAAAAIRPKQMLGLDTIQKGAGHSLARTLALDLTPEGIYVTEIMPGSTDTGFFDNDFTMKTAIEVSGRMGYEYTQDNYPVFTAEQIGDAAKYVMDANCNVREIVLLPYGQFPHLGA